ncbi:SMP-30/gluconolactonase/LRE family protein [Arachidicoccus sp.]|jgi:gluconolactonase|uniref:SMP-30/gluconolactonase/LRE family protein n=1 Tax=Arachidicoccus sp. TaxID=1872624 RepID=UPI003D1D5178
MNYNRFSIPFLLLFLLCGGFLFGQNDNGSFEKLPLAAKGATLNLISDQFSFSEGPAVDKQGDIFFTDQPNDRIWEYSTAGRLSVFMDKTGHSNGLYFNPQGDLIACADEKDELWSISREKNIKVLMTGFQGRRLNGPNDLWINENGGIYFTDPYYQRSYWVRKKPDIKAQRVYFLPKGKHDPIVVEDALLKPNGIVGTPNGKYLYVADIEAGKTFRYKIHKDGTLYDRQLFVTQGSDGMTLDNQGNVYLCGNGVTIYNKKGKLVGHISIPQNWTGNICFGGKKRNLLFITASKAVYTLKMNVKGVE